MRRYRRLVLIDRVIPFLAALVGLVALAGAVTVQVNADTKTRAVADAVTELRSAVDAASARPVLAPPPADDGSAAAIAALEEKVAALEAALAEQQAAVAALPAAAVPGETAAVQPAEIDPNLPTTDCIPLGTRFMVIPNESFPICQSTVVLKTGMITDDTVTFDQAGLVVETASAPIAGSSCSVIVFTADSAGFAEVRVTCT
jgi:hypothetical protein